jgi:hypothetical protein
MPLDWWNCTNNVAKLSGTSRTTNVLYQDIQSTGSMRSKSKVAVKANLMQQSNKLAKISQVFRAAHMADLDRLYDMINLKAGRLDILG